MGNLLKPNIKVFGQARVVRKFRKNFPLATKIACRGACEETAGRLRTLIRNLAPELREKQQLDTHKGMRAWLKEGYLKNSIAMTPVSVRDGTGYVIGSTAPYAAHVEYGVQHPGVPLGTRVYFWSQKEGIFRVAEGGVKSHHIKAQPFFRPALGWGEKQLYFSSGAWWKKELKRYLKGG